MTQHLPQVAKDLVELTGDGIAACKILAAWVKAKRGISDIYEMRLLAKGYERYQCAKDDKERAHRAKLFRSQVKRHAAVLGV
ncbi:hypothetical protein [Limibacillus sp. MBR-115]|jgi:hypothetical protein|uniref:hypothetical protein n=1 Tax=Limibacillus sp. MBR-115 TaxID=3156465 RepID=UPI0033975A85